MKLKIANWKEMYETDINEGRGIELKTVDAIKANGERHLEGIFSPFFGSSDSKSEQLDSSFSCKCGDLKGKFYLGVKCPKCNTHVEEDKGILDRTGWMVLDEQYCLIHPILYGHLEKLISKKVLTGIIKFENSIDENGNFIIDEEKPHQNKGILYLRDNFDEIIETYAKPDREDIKDFIYANREKLFINHIPVYSLLLRDIMKVGTTVVSNEINKKYNCILGNIVTLNKKDTTLDQEDLKVLPILFETQEMLNEINNFIQKQVATKKGLIRENIMGVRLNFSARNVIVPLLERCRMDEIVLPYLTFNVLYQYEIINILKTDMSYPEAYDKWQRSCQEFDETVYMIMKELIAKTNGGLKVLMGRNPTLNFGSVLLMTVKDVKTVVDDVTMAIPLNILSVLGADFDGDVLYIISLKDQKMVKSFEIFNPRNMMIDRNNFTFNTRMSLIKDQSIGIYTFNQL